MTRAARGAQQLPPERQPVPGPGSEWMQHSVRSGHKMERTDTRVVRNPVEIRASVLRTVPASVPTGHPVFPATLRSRP